MAAPCSCSYSCSGFLGLDEVNLAPVPTMTGELHPLLHDGNFDAEIDTDKIKSSLRLASRLLQSPAVAPFITVLTRGQLRDVDDNPVTMQHVHHMDHQARLLGRPAPIIKITAQMNQDQINLDTVAHARKVLNAMAGVVEFQLEDFPPGGRGHCEPVLTPMSPAARRVLGPNGCCSIIRLSRAMYNELTQLIDAHRGIVPDRKMYMQMAQVAFVLTHEIAHALNLATQGDRLPEICYQNFGFGEMGLVLEHIIFHGRLLDTDSFNVLTRNELAPGTICPNAAPEKETCFGILMELPSQAIERHYLVPNGNSDYAAHGPRHAYDVIWRMPCAFYQSLFSEEFWQIVANSQQVTALHAPRVCAWLFTSDDVAQLRPASLQDANLAQPVKDALRAVLNTPAESQLKHLHPNRYQLRR